MVSQLSISHLIFLTRDERYTLVSGKDIVVVGVSISAKSPEDVPSEVFCRYILQNRPENIRILNTPEGYLINLPQKANVQIPTLSNDEWRAMSRTEQEEWYERYRLPATAESLKDIKDGGAAYLRFHYVSLAKQSRIVHIIEIKTMESLLQSLLY
jgi:hypothetical protein